MLKGIEQKQQLLIEVNILDWQFIYTMALTVCDTVHYTKHVHIERLHLGKKTCLLYRMHFHYALLDADYTIHIYKYT